MRCFRPGKAVGVASLVGFAISCDAQMTPDYQGEPRATVQGRVEAAIETDGAEVGILWLTADPGAACSRPAASCGVATAARADPAEVSCMNACGSMPECTDTEAMDAWSACQEACGEDVKVDYSVHFGICFSGAVTQSVAVSGEFPARFELDLLDLPPEDAFLTAGDTGVAVALGTLVALEPGTGPVSLPGDGGEPPDWMIGASETHLLVYAVDPIVEPTVWSKYLGGTYDSGYHVVRVVPGIRCGLPVPVEDLSGGLDQDLTDVALVCGNGICEEGEDCDRCSDCGCVDGEAEPASTGITNQDEGYSCFATSNTLQPAVDGLDTEVKLRLAPIEELIIPEL